MDAFIMTLTKYSVFALKKTAHKQQGGGGIQTLIT